jgi:hypothetical protein
MSKPIHTAVVTNGIDDHFAVWQARGEENDRATRRKLMIMTAIFILSAAIVSGAWLIQ